MADASIAPGGSPTDEAGDLVSIKITRATRQRLRIASGERETSMTRLLEAAVDFYLEPGEGRPRRKGRRRPVSA